MSFLLVFPRTGKIFTFAGTGSAGISGDGGAAISAGIYYPKYIWGDTNSNVYFSFLNFGSIRKVVVGSNIITNYVGTASPYVNGYSGDGAQATLTSLSSPNGVFVSSTGAMYIGDYGNSRVRVRAVSGIVKTLAGRSTTFYGDGQKASLGCFSGPSGMFVDSASTLYIVDGGNFRVRKITASGIVSTIAGTDTNTHTGDTGRASAASLTSPISVWADSTGVVYIGEQFGYYIRQIDTDNIITVFAGQGYSGVGAENALAQYNSIGTPISVFGNSVGVLYFSDMNYHRIRKVVISSRVTTNYAGMHVFNIVRTWCFRWHLNGTICGRYCMLHIDLC